jgi:hypothetical protein
MMAHIAYLPNSHHYLQSANPHDSLVFAENSIALYFINFGLSDFQYFASTHKLYWVIFLWDMNWPVHKDNSD